MKYFIKIIIYFLLITLNKSIISDNFELEPITTRLFECEQITGECSDQDYKYTSSASKLKDGSTFFGSQKIADQTIKSFELVQPCSNYLKLFLCGTYKPSCHAEANHLIIQPCKSMCQHVYKRCYSLMLKFNLKWNTELNCSRFLDDKSDSCMKDTGYLKDYPLSADFSEYEKKINFLYERIIYSKNNITKKMMATTKISSTTTRNRKDLNQNKYVCTLNKTIKNKCFLKCDANILYNINEKITTRRFVFVLSVLCLLSTCLALLIYFLNTINYEYPNILFIFMSFCYLIQSIVHLVALILGQNVTSCQKLSTSQYVYLNNESDSNNYCLIVLILVYYFRMASLLYWLLIAICWFIIIQFNLTSNKINQFSIRYSHFIVWLVPCSIVFMIIFTYSGNNMSELTGLCIIGEMNKNAILSYLIIPSSIYLFLGLIALSLGYIKIIKFNSYQRKKFNQIGLSISLTAIPFIIITSCEIYEYLNMNKWLNLPKLIEINSKFDDLNNKLKNLTNKQTPFTPIIITKIFMQFLNAIIILFLISINYSVKKTQNNNNNNNNNNTFCLTKQTNNFYSSRTITNIDSNSYQFFPPPPLPLPIRYQCSYLITKQQEQNDYNNYSMLTSASNEQQQQHHYCTPNLTMQTYNCECSSKNKIHDRKLSTFMNKDNTNNSEY